MKAIAALAATAALAPAAALAQQPYPNKPVRVIVTTVPGPLDAFARIVAGKMGERLKQNFFIENRPGAGGNIVRNWPPRRRPTVTPCCLRSTPRLP
jgi:tripartite-type tricarboxylate transporter receptor subunit TctC